MPSPYAYYVIECSSFEELQKAFNENSIRIGFYFYGVYQLKDTVALVFAAKGATNPRVPTMPELKKELAQEFPRYALQKIYGSEVELLEEFLEWVQKQGFTIAVL